MLTESRLTISQHHTATITSHVSECVHEGGSVVAAEETARPPFFLRDKTEIIVFKMIQVQIVSKVRSAGKRQQVSRCGVVGVRDG